MALGVRKFDSVFEIKFGSNNSVKNIKEIEDALLKINNIDILEQLEKYYVLLNKNFPSKDLVYLIEEINKNKYRINNISNKEEDNNIFQKLDELKQQTNNLSNISIIEPDKFDNDKIDGLRRNAMYIKLIVDCKVEVYEVGNINALNNLVNGDLSIIRNMSEKDIIKYLKDYSNLIKCSIIDVDTRNSNELNSDEMYEEYKQIKDDYVRSKYESQENLVLKEKVDLQNYIDEYMNGEKFSIMLNSNGERIYLVGDKTFKFTGDKNRSLKEIKSDGKDKENVNVESFNKEYSNNKNVKETPVSDFNEFEDYVNCQNEIYYIIEGMKNNFGLTDNQLSLFTSFLSFGVNYEVGEKPFPSIELEKYYNLYVSLYGTLNKYSNSDIDVIMDNRLNIHNVKKLTLTNPELSNIEKAGFISVAIILEGTLVLGLIFALMALVKK